MFLSFGNPAPFVDETVAGMVAEAEGLLDGGRRRV